MAMKAPSAVSVQRTAAPKMSMSVGQSAVGSTAQRFQPIAAQITSRRSAAGPTMMMATPSAASSGSFTTSGFINNVQNMQNQTAMRRGTPTMFAGGMAPSSGFSIKSSGATSVPMRNYFDSKLGAGRRGDVKMMASYKVTFMTPEGE